VWVNEEASTGGLLGATERTGGARGEEPPPAAAGLSAMERDRRKLWKAWRRCRPTGLEMHYSLSAQYRCWASMRAK
jgi:hypothetical protein